MKLETAGSPVQLPAEVIIRRRKRVRTASGGSTETWEMVRARGHLDEVEELRAAATTSSALTARPLLHAPSGRPVHRCHGQQWAQQAACSLSVLPRSPRMQRITQLVAVIDSRMSRNLPESARHVGGAGGSRRRRVRGPARPRTGGQAPVRGRLSAMEPAALHTGTAAHGL